MKKIYLSLLMSLIFTLLSAQSISVTTPDGLDYWDIGKTYEIEWRVTGNMDPDVKIRLFDKTGRTKIMGITEKTSNDGKFNWRIPLSLQAGEYIVRIKTIDNRVSGDSKIFHIQDRRLIKLNIISPSGGEKFRTPGTLMIKWNMENAHLVEHVKLILMKGRQILDTTVVNNNGSVTAPLADTINDGNDYSIRLEDADDSSVFDESGNFEIYHSSPASISMETKPRIYYIVGETMKIKWRCNGFDGVVNVNLFKNGNMVKNLANSIRDNFFNWNVNESSGSNYSIKVSSVNNSNLSASGNNFFILLSSDLLVFSRGIFQKGSFLNGERTKIKFIVKNPSDQRFQVSMKIGFFKGKINRPTRRSIKRIYALAGTKYTGNKTAYINPGGDTSFDLPVTINDKAGDYTVIITVLPSNSANVKDPRVGDNTIYGYYKVALKLLKLKK